MNVFCSVRPEGNQIHLAGDKSGKGRLGTGADANRSTLPLSGDAARPALASANKTEVLVNPVAFRNSRRFMEVILAVLRP